MNMDVLKYTSPPLRRLDSPLLSLMDFSGAGGFAVNHDGTRRDLGRLGYESRSSGCGVTPILAKKRNCD
jgi:hypothetical protein